MLHYSLCPQKVVITMTCLFESINVKDNVLTVGNAYTHKILFYFLLILTSRFMYLWSSYISSLFALPHVFLSILLSRSMYILSFHFHTLFPLCISFWLRPMYLLSFYLFTIFPLHFLMFSVWIFSRDQCIPHPSNVFIPFTLHFLMKSFRFFPRDLCISHPSIFYSIFPLHFLTIPIFFLPQDQRISYPCIFLLYRLCYALPSAHSVAIYASPILRFLFFHSIFLSISFCFFPQHLRVFYPTIHSILLCISF